MSAFARALWPVGIAFGVLAEAIGKPPLPALDAATGFALLGLGLIAWRTRSRFDAGAIMALGGLTWFAGSLAGWAVFLHRGALAQLILTYPTPRARPITRPQLLAVIAAYAYAAAYPIADSNVATIIFALALVTMATRRLSASRGLERRLGAHALAAGCLFSAVLLVTTALRIAAPGAGSGGLAFYETAVLLIAACLFTDLLWGAWTQAAITAVVLDLGQVDGAATLRDRLARTLADPTLEIGYWHDEQATYVDETGSPLQLPQPENGRVTRLITDGGTPLAMLVHDPAVLDDPQLVEGITAATKLAVANARLQADVRARVDEVERSRRRLLDAADEQRRALELELRHGAEQRLVEVAKQLADGDPALETLRVTIDAARNSLRELARGIHPAVLTDSGIRAGVGELAARAPLEVQVHAPTDRLPSAVEATAYFVCSEAITNITKHAQASTASIRITATDTEVIVEVTDDGIGGADLTHGSGLRGLADRVETLGGRLTITSAPGHGTRLAAALPLARG